MKKSGLLNPQLCRVIAEIGHGDSIVVADAGLPIPSSCERIDLSVVPGLPRFIEVLAPIVSELDIERAIVASELVEQNPQVYAELRSLLASVPIEMVSHEALKQKTADAHAVVRTGEVTSYANVILIGGVSSVFRK